jgi:hypothetical protein
MKRLTVSVAFAAFLAVGRLRSICSTVKILNYGEVKPCIREETCGTKLPRRRHRRNRAPAGRTVRSLRWQVKTWGVSLLKRASDSTQCRLAGVAEVLVARFPVPGNHGH